MYPRKYTKVKNLANRTPPPLSISLILSLWSHFSPFVFHLFVLLNPGQTVGRTHLAHVRLNLSALLTNPFGSLTGNKHNSTTPSTSLKGRGAVLVTTGSSWHITGSNSGTGISVHKVPHLYWIQQRQHDDQTAWPEMIHALMRIHYQSCAMVSSPSVCVFYPQKIRINRNQFVL